MREIASRYIDGNSALFRVRLTTILKSGGNYVMSSSSSCNQTKGKDGKFNKIEKPKRPACAYNLFFFLERERLLEGGGGLRNYTTEDIARSAACQRSEKPKRKHVKTHGVIGFQELSQKIASAWKSLDLPTKKRFEMQAKVEVDEFRKRYATWKANQQGSNISSETDQRETTKIRPAKRSKPSNKSLTQKNFNYLEENSERGPSEMNPSNLYVTKETAADDNNDNRPITDLDAINQFVSLLKSADNLLSETQISNLNCIDGDTTELGLYNPTSPTNYLHHHEEGDDFCFDANQNDILVSTLFSPSEISMTREGQESKSVASFLTKEASNHQADQSLVNHLSSWYHINPSQINDSHNNLIKNDFQSFSTGDHLNRLSPPADLKVTENPIYTESSISETYMLSSKERLEIEWKQMANNFPNSYQLNSDQYFSSACMRQDFGDATLNQICEEILSCDDYPALEHGYCESPLTFQDNHRDNPNHL